MASTDTDCTIGPKQQLKTHVKKAKHLKSFAFYFGEDQIYSKDLASSIQNQLKNIKDKELLEISLIDSNPANNPQPPKKYLS